MNFMVSTVIKIKEWGAARNRLQAFLVTNPFNNCHRTSEKTDNMRRLCLMIGRKGSIQNSLLGMGQVELLGLQEGVLRDPVNAGQKVFV